MAVMWLRKWHESVNCRRAALVREGITPARTNRPERGDHLAGGRRSQALGNHVPSARGDGSEGHQRPLVPCHIARLHRIVVRPSRWSDSWARSAARQATSGQAPRSGYQYAGSRRRKAWSRTINRKKRFLATSPGQKRGSGPEFAMLLGDGTGLPSAASRERNAATQTDRRSILAVCLLRRP